MRKVVLCSIAVCLQAGCVGTVIGVPPRDSGTATASDGGRDSGIGASDGGSLDAGLWDGGAPDGGAGDAGSDAGACLGALLCEDFESYPSGGPPLGPWSVSSNGGAVVVDTAHAHSGTRSVHVSTDGMAAYRSAYLSVSGAPVFPVPGNVVYGRMMVWLTAAPTMTTHWTNIQGSGQVSGQGFSAVVRYGGQVSQQLMANYDTQGVSSDCWQHSAVQIPVQRWACFEWRYDGPNNTMNFWLDGAAVDALTVVGAGQGCINNGTNGQWLFPQFDKMSLGWEHYQTSIPIDLWIDDVALDGARIGCPP